MENPTNTSRDTYKTIYIILFKLLSIDDSRNATDLVTYQCDSRENVKEFVVTSPHVMTHPIIVRELDLAKCVSPSSNGTKMRSLWTNQMKS